MCIKHTRASWCIFIRPDDSPKHVDRWTTAFKMHFTRRILHLPVVVVLVFVVVVHTNAAAPTTQLRSTIKIDLDTVVNVVSNEFVSFSIDPERLLAMRDQSQQMLGSLTSANRSAYFRIDGSESANAWIANAEVLIAITRWLRTINLKPIVTLPRGNLTTPRRLIDTLGAVRRANVSHCTWQLDSVFEPSTDTLAYVDELLALWHIRSALLSDEGGDWSVIGADLTDRVPPAAAELYADLTLPLTVATVYRRSEEGGATVKPAISESSSIDSLAQPQWLQLTAQSANSTMAHIERGLQFGHILGNAAQNGYAAVFQPVLDADVATPTLPYYIAVLHRQLLGTRVLGTQLRHDEKDATTIMDHRRTMLYAHCDAGTNAAGAFAVMGVNMATTTVRLATTMPANVTGSLVLQYILRADADGALLVNDMPVPLGDRTLRAARKMRKPNRPTSFTLPARSVAFWVFPEANVAVCTTEDTLPVASSGDAEEATATSPSEVLLQQLIRESVFGASNDNDVMTAAAEPTTVVTDDDDDDEATTADDDDFADADNNHLREKRQLPIAVPDIRPAAAAAGLQKLFGKFELVKPKKFQIQPLFKRPPAGPASNKAAAADAVAIPPVVSSVYDVYQPDPAEDLFKSSENVDLPKGDVYFEVGSDHQSPDYVAFDEPAETKTAGTAKQKSHPGIGNQLDEDVPDDIALQRYPNQFLEFYPADVGRPAANDDDGDAVMMVHNVGGGSELWEPRGTYDAHVIPATAAEETDEQHERHVPKIVRAREPTWQENQENLRKAKSTLEGIYYKSPASDAQAPRGLPGDRYKKMSNDDTFFQSRRRRRRAIVDPVEQEQAVEEASIAAIGENNDNSIDERTAPAVLSPYQERLLYKMTKVMQELQRLIGHAQQSDEPEAAGSRLSALVDDLHDIEGHLLKSRAKKPTGFMFGKADMSNGFFAKHSAKAAAAAAAAAATSIVDPLPDNIPKRCKALALSLEEQCLREIGSGKSAAASSTRTRTRFPRSLVGGEFDAWNDGLADDDPRHNMIYKQGEERMPFVTAYFVRNVPASDPHADGITTTPHTTTATAAQPESHHDADNRANDGDTSPEKYASPRFMVTFTRSVEGLLGVVNDHVAGWWRMMS